MKFTFKRKCFSEEKKLFQQGSYANGKEIIFYERSRIINESIRVELVLDEIEKEILHGDVIDTSVIAEKIQYL